jgi:hypothetical protein
MLQEFGDTAADGRGENNYGMDGMDGMNGMWGSDPG